MVNRCIQEKHYFFALALSVFIGIGAVALALSLGEISAHTRSVWVGCHDSRPDPDCNCEDFISRFEARSWSAGEMADAESNCNPGLGGPENEVGLFQIHPINCPGSWTCPTTGETVIDNSGDCSALWNATNNIIVACAMSNGGRDWRAWGWPDDPGFCNIWYPDNVNWATTPDQYFQSW